MSECKHKKTTVGYGFRRTIGLYGLGGYNYCNDCHKTLSWVDDRCCDTSEEINHNKERCKELGIEYEDFI